MPKGYFMDDAIIAIDWLNSYSNEMDDQEEGEACKRIADFLRKEWHRRDKRGNANVARRFRVPVEDVTRAVNKDRADRGVKVP